MPPHCRSLSLAFRIVLAASAAMLWQACGGADLAGPKTGQISVTTTTTGEQPDQDGYAVSLDGADGVPIGPNASIGFTTTDGDHDVSISGLAPNCGVQGRIRQTVHVTEGETTSVPFNVICSSTTGGLHVVTVTSGPQPDADGFEVVIDQGTPEAVAANGSITLTALEAGDHAVALTGVADNCTVADANPRTASVTAGAIVEVTFTVTCVATRGAVTVTTVTTGAAPDSDGYTAQADTGTAVPVPPNGAVTLADLTPGSHAIRLAGVAANCLVQGDNPRTVQVSVGDTAAVEFQVLCAAGVGHWTTMQSGTDADLPEVWGTGPRDVFVVAEGFNADQGVLEGLILHYDGSAWTPQLRNPDLRLRGVWGSSPTDVFAAGFDFGTPEARMVHYDGNAWTPMTLPTPEIGEEFSLQSIWGSSATDVFAVGGLFNGLFDESLILHYDGAGWQRMAISGTVRPELLDVWGSGPSDVYAVGRQDDTDPSPGVILHYDGTTWSPVLGEEGVVFRSVWGSSGTDIFAAGFKLVGQDQDAVATGVVWHSDGKDWSEMSLPAVGVLYELWGTSAHDVFAVGQSGVVLHYDGTAWTGATPTVNTLLGVWGSSPIDVFAVGNQGTILHGTP